MGTSPARSTGLPMRIALLAEVPQAIAPLATGYETQWPDWYCAGGASARADLAVRMQRDALPLGLVALEGGAPVGTCALTGTSGGLVTAQMPWVGGLWVAPGFRRRGIAAALLARARSEARRLGFAHLFALTAEARPLFAAEQWTMIEVVDIAGEPHSIYAIET